MPVKRDKNVDNIDENVTDIKTRFIKKKYFCAI